MLDLESVVNENLSHVSSWLVANKLSLNIDKSNSILFHPPQKAVNYVIRLHIGDKIIKKEKQIKDLGIYIDSHLNWKYQVLHISKENKTLCGCYFKNKTLCKYISSYNVVFRVATVLENPGKSWNWQKKIPGPVGVLEFGLQSLKILEWAKFFHF